MIPDRIEVNIAGGLDFELPHMAQRAPEVRGRPPGRHPRCHRDASFSGPRCATRVQARPGVAVGCGSRGIANIGEIAKCRRRMSSVRSARKPFVFPCMGSHGAATAEGQKQVLGSYGITEATIGVPVQATHGHGDRRPSRRRHAGAHGPARVPRPTAIVVINRIKPHTGFRGATESGLTKMLSIGIGKIVGAATYHTHGMDRFPELLPQIRDVHLAQPQCAVRRRHRRERLRRDRA